MRLEAGYYCASIKEKLNIFSGQVTLGDSEDKIHIHFENWVG